MTIDEVVQAEMSSPTNLRVILFDMGGVVVLSPFQAILNHEIEHGIPSGWVNYSISKTAPNGFWHRLEKGSIPMDSDFFAGFNRDLHDVTRWEAFYTAQQATNPQLPKLIPPVPQVDGERLFHSMMAVSMHPDPWMLPALQRLKKSGKYVMAALSNTVIFPPGHGFHREQFFEGSLQSMFDVFVSSAHVGLRKPDPRIYELALQRVNDFTRANADTERGRAGRWSETIEAEEVLFLDDIGENLKAAKKLGFQTLRVFLGRAFEAVDLLEDITGLALAGDHPRIPIKANVDVTKAKM